MGKKRVMLWGPQRRGFVKIDDEATKGATVGKDLFNADGTLFDPSVLITEILKIRLIRYRVFSARSGA